MVRRVDDVLHFATTDVVLHEPPRGRITMATVFAARDEAGQIVIFRSTGPVPEPMAVIGEPGLPSADAAGWLRHLALGIQLLDMAPPADG